MKKLSPFLPALLFYVLVFWLSSQDLGIDLPGRGLDKLAHFAEFSILGFFLSLGFFRSFSLGRSAGIILVLATGLALSVLDEFHQSFVPRRSSEVWDALADLAGIVAGILVYLRIAEKRKHGRGEGGT